MTSTVAPRTTANCRCRCHSYGPGSNAACDPEHDTGSTGVPGVPSCSPHDLDDQRATTVAGVTTATASSVTAEPCPGSCNREWYRLTESEQQRPDHPIRPVLGDPVWCEPCTRRIDRAMQEFPDLYAHLEADFAARTSQPGDGGHTKQVHAPSPSPQVDEQEAVAAWLTQLEDLVRAGRDFTPRRDPTRHGRAHLATAAPALNATVTPTRAAAVRQLRQAVADLDDARLLATANDHLGNQVGSDARVRACQRAVLAAVAVARAAPLDGAHEPHRSEDLTLVRVTTAVDVVRGSLDWLLASEWAVETGSEILRRRARVRAMTLTDTGSKHLTRACPRCEMKALRQHSEQGYVECQNCGRLLTTEEYDRLGAERTA